MRAEVEASRAWGVPWSVFLGWSEPDRLAALALLQLEAETCSGCGHPQAESMAADNQYAYKATLLRCHACAAADRATDEKNVDRAGLRVRVERRQA